MSGIQLGASDSGLAGFHPLQPFGRAGCARLLAALAAHPDGLVVDVLLAGMSAPEERQPMLMALRTPATAEGKVIRSGDRRHAYVAGVRVRLAVARAQGRI
jgi:hypothetical protein